MSSGTLLNIGYALAPLIGVGGLQFVYLRKFQRAQIKAQTEQAQAAADNSDVNSARTVQQMALEALGKKSEELDKCEQERLELRNVVAGLVDYIKSLPGLPPVPRELIATVRRWSDA